MGLWKGTVEDLVRQEPQQRRASGLDSRSKPSRFEIINTPLVGLRVLCRKPVTDQRGYLERLFCEDELKEIMRGAHIVQVNRSLSRKQGTVRGLHFQMPPHAEMKLVSCLKGHVLDVAIDLRRGSPSFLHWHGEVLSDDNHRTLMIPQGFAHGFQALSDECELLYLHTAAYEPSAERTINARDPRIGINWPLTIAEMSSRDQSHPMLGAEFKGIDL